MKKISILFLSIAMMLNLTAIAFADETEVEAEVSVETETTVETEEGEMAEEMMPPKHMKDGEHRDGEKMHDKMHDKMKKKIKKRIFKDIKGHRFERGIEMLREEGILNGDTPDDENAEETTLRPDEPLNRAELAKILVEYLIENAPEVHADVLARVQAKLDAQEVCFEDLDADKWFAYHACVLKELEIVRGYKNEGNKGYIFRGGRNVTAAEAFKMIELVLNGTEGYEEGENEPWYKRNVEKMIEKGGVPETVVGFNTEMTRGQMADALVRLKKHKEGGKEKVREYLGEKRAVYLETTFEQFEEERFERRMERLQDKIERLEAELEEMEEMLDEMEEMEDEMDEDDMMDEDEMDEEDEDMEDEDEMDEEDEEDMEDEDEMDEDEEDDMEDEDEMDEDENDDMEDEDMEDEDDMEDGEEQ
jgi:hypothetical protein